MTKLQDLLTVLLREPSVPKTREALSSELGVDDRTLRYMIRDLRMLGIPVCSNSHVKGYWIATGKDLDHMVADYRSRGLACLEAANKIQMRRQLEGQERWEI